MICHSRKLALRLKHFARWRKSARTSLRKPRHYRPACSFGLSSVTLQLIITAEAYISSAANLKPLPYYFPPMRQEKFSVTLKWNKKIFPGASVFGDFKWNKKIFPGPSVSGSFPLTSSPPTASPPGGAEETGRAGWGQPSAR